MWLNPNTSACSNCSLLPGISSASIKGTTDTARTMIVGASGVSKSACARRAAASALSTRARSCRKDHNVSNVDFADHVPVRDVDRSQRNSIGITLTSQDA